jgi:hypothetical protein
MSAEQFFWGLALIAVLATVGWLALEAVHAPTEVPTPLDDLMDGPEQVGDDTLAVFAEPSGWTDCKDPDCTWCVLPAEPEHDGAQVIDFTGDLWTRVGPKAWHSQRLGVWFSWDIVAGLEPRLLLNDDTDIADVHLDAEGLAMAGSVLADIDDLPTTEGADS